MALEKGGYVHDTTDISAGRLRCVLIALGAALFILFALSVTRAQAVAPERPPLETFGSANAPTFTQPAGMAVDQSSGDLLVTDTSAGTLSRWHEDGTPSNFSALAGNVIDGAAGGADETPQGEIFGGAAPNEVQIAVDNSETATDGNIYVTNSPSGVVDIFASDGEHIGQLTESSGGAFGESCGVAVDEDGNVYVGDFSNGVHKFANPPVDGASELTIPASEPCTVGAGGGAVFATTWQGVITKFDASSGAEDYVVSPGSNTTVSVDPGSDHVLAVTGEEIVEYHAGASGATVVSSTELESEATGAAVNETTGNLYTAREGGVNVEVFGPGTVGEQEFDFKVVEDGSGSGTVGCEVEGGPAEPCPESSTEYPEGTEITLAATPGPGSEFAGFSGGGCSTSPCALTLEANVTVTATFNQMPPSVVNDPEGALTQTTAVLNGHVDNNDDPAGSTCSFQVALASDPTFSSPIATPACIPPTVTGSANTAVTATATGLDAATEYIYRVRATNSGGTSLATPAEPFTTDTASPTIVEQLPLDVDRTSATLRAKVNPNGLSTTYHFEFGTDTSYGIHIPAGDELVAGSGSDPVTVSAFRSGLQEASVYYFRLVATNSKGTAVGPDQRLETLNEHDLPNDRAFELVTPADKGSSGSVAGDLSVQQATQVSADGESLMYPLTNGLDTSTAGGWLRQRAARTETGWLSTQISAQSLIPPPGYTEQQKPSHFHFASPAVDCGFLETYNPITEDTPQIDVELGVTNLYRWSADGDYELVTNRIPLNPELNPGSAPAYYGKVDASDDCSRVFFTSPYVFIPGASGLYEWEEGTLRDAGLRPDDSVGPNLGGAGRAVLGGEVNSSGTARWNAVSPDGSRLFFTAISEDSGNPAVFMREDDPSCEPLPAPCTVEISASETAVPTNGARFEAASPDGSRVFFRANYGIADTSSAGPTDEACGPLSSETEFTSNPVLEEKPCDLYAYDVESEELTDLSADANVADAGIGAQIQGAVAVDEDGSHVYFAALGQLVSGKGRTYAENTTGFGSANIYLAREGQPLSYVATLAEHGPALDAGRTGDLLGPGQTGFGPGAALMRRSQKWVANTTPDGGELLFVSSLNLTGWDSGGIDKYAAYIWSANTGRLACVSCRPDGLESIALPFGWKLGQPAQSSWLLAGPDQSNSNRPSSLSEDGSKVFFTSPDVLAQGAAAGKRNVYQWQEGQVFFLAVAEGAGLNGLAGYRGSSASGDDVFIATGERLAPQDTDSLSDVYDVRVDGGFSVVTQPPDCQVDEAVSLVPNQIYCQNDRTPQPQAPGPPTAGFSGPGNPPASKPRPKPCRKGKVRRRGKCVKRKNRGAKSKRNRAAKTNRGGSK